MAREFQTEEVTAYVLVPYEDALGPHKVGDQVTFKLESYEDRTNMDTLLRYGMVSEELPEELQQATANQTRQEALNASAQQAQLESGSNASAQGRKAKRS